MLPYIALLLIPALFSSYAVKVGKNKGKVWTLSISKSRNSSAIPVFFFLLLMLLMLRHETIGRDLLNYKYIFLNNGAQGLKYVFYTWKESLFRLYNWLLLQITDDYQVYLMVTAVVTVLPIAYVYNKDRTHGYLKVAIFVNMSTFIMLFSGLRQSMAMAIGMLAYDLVKKRKLAAFLLLALVAMLIHHSGFIIFVMYPLYHIKLKKKHLLIVIPAMIFVFAFNRQIFDVVINILSAADEKYDTSATSTGAFGALVLFALFAVFSYVITDEKQCDAETLGLRNFLLMAVAIQCFAPIHTLAMRINYYFILFIPIALGKCMSYTKYSMRQVAKAAEIVICVYFTVLFVYNTYQSYVTGISALDTIPYIPFWKGN